MKVTAISASGMSDAMGRFDRSATATAKLGSEDGKKVDLAKEAMEIIAAKSEVQANAAVARTGSRMVGSLVDILA
jgi:flagellar hook protein FlgE